MPGGTLTLVAKETKQPSNKTLKGVFRRARKAKLTVYRKRKSNKRHDINTNELYFMKQARLERLKYTSASVVQTNGTTQNTWANAYRMDSIYDPEYSNPSKNKKVAGYNQLAALYKHYKVYGFKAKITFQNMVSEPTVVYAAANTDTTWATDFGTSKLPTDIITRHSVKGKILGPAGSSNDKAVIYYKCAPWEPIGLTKKQWADDIQCGAAFGSNTANPTSANPFFVIGLGAGDDGVTQAKAMVTIELTYLTRVFDPIDNTDS